MHAGKFNVFGNGVFYDFSVLRNSVEFYFFGILHKFRYHDGVFFRYMSSEGEELFQPFHVVAYVHGGTREDVRRPYQYGESYIFDKCLDVVHRSQFFPCRLVDTELVEHEREFVPVLGTVY